MRIRYYLTWKVANATLQPLTLLFVCLWDTVVGLGLNRSPKLNGRRVELIDVREVRHWCWQKIGERVVSGQGSAAAPKPSPPTWAQSSPRPFWRLAGIVLGICITLTTADAICAGNSENLSDRALITCIFFCQISMTCLKKRWSLQI